MSENGLEKALERARAAEAETRRLVHAEAAGKERLRLENSQRVERLHQVSRTFVNRAVGAGIPDELIRFCVGYESVGIFKKRYRFLLEEHQGWVIASPSMHTDLSGTTYHEGLYMLRDGTPRVAHKTGGGHNVAYEVSEESFERGPLRFWSDRNERWVLDALAGYLLRHGAA